MIAANFRRFPDAQLAQLELDLVVDGADQVQRDSFWTWLMETGIPKVMPSRPAPSWWTAVKRRAKALAQSVRVAIQSLFQQE